MENSWTRHKKGKERKLKRSLEKEKNRKLNRLSMRKVKYSQELSRCHMEDQGVRPWAGRSSSVIPDCNPEISEISNTECVLWS